MANILEFKKGQIITRVSRSKPYILGGLGDGSYMGDPLLFIGIANGHVYFKNKDPFSVLMLGSDKIFGLQLELFSEGWEVYIDPLTLLEDSDITLGMTQNDIENKINKAIQDEDYELAEKLRKQL